MKCCRRSSTRTRCACSSSRTIRCSRKCIRRKERVMKIVDMRLRPPLKTWVGKMQFTRGDDYFTKLGYERPASTRTQKMGDLLKEMDEAGVQWGVVMGRQSEEPLGVIPNDEIAQCVA